MSYEAKLKELGYDVQPVEMNTGRFLHAVRTGNLIDTSGQVSAWDGVADPRASLGKILPL